MTRQAVTKHLIILEEANLVATLKQGRKKLHYLNAVPISEIAERWISSFDRGPVRVLADLKQALEDAPMENPKFVYTTYIRTTPERLWQALTDPSFTRRWWTVTLDTDWQVGSTMTWDNRGVTIADPDQVILESDPFHRLAYTWHSYTPDWKEGCGADDATFAALTTERRSRVAFDIEPVGDMVKLLVVHDNFDPGSVAAGMVSAVWPLALSSLKSLLETGQPLDMSSARSRA